MRKQTQFVDRRQSTNILIDKQIRLLKQEGESLRASRNDLSKQIGLYMRNKDFAKAEEIKQTVTKNNERIAEIESLQDNKDESDDVFTVDVDAANNKRDYKKAKISDTINVSSIFDDFM